MVKHQELNGKRFGRLVAIELADDRFDSNGTTRLWKCRCDCGKIVYKSARILNYATKKERDISCGCASKSNLVGKTIGDYYVEKFLYSTKKAKFWQCICKCGDSFVKDTGHLVPDRCRCQKERHILSCLKQRLYWILYNMRKRCYDKNNKSYDNYGGRGIKVCQDWLSSPRNFVGWAILNGYKKGLTIDRINNNKDYCPENCRWVDKFIQANNKRTNLNIEYKGETKTLKQWCRELELPYRKTHKRLYLYHWDIEQCFDEKERVGFI